MTEQHRLAAIVSADVAGYSRLMARDEGGTLAALKDVAPQTGRSRSRRDAAIAEFEQTMKLSPLDPQQGGNAKQELANALCWAGRTEGTLFWARRAIRECPGWSATLRLLIGALWLSGRHFEAKEAAQNFVEMFPADRIRGSHCPAERRRPVSSYQPQMAHTCYRVARP